MRGGYIYILINHYIGINSNIEVNWWVRTRYDDSRGNSEEDSPQPHSILWVLVETYSWSVP